MIKEQKNSSSAEEELIKEIYDFIIGLFRDIFRIFAQLFNSIAHLD